MLASPVELIIKRYATVDVVMNEFFQKLQTGSKTTTVYPKDELECAYSLIKFRRDSGGL